MNPYSEDYFLRGTETGLSLYENYRWLPDLTIPMVETMISHLGITKSDQVLDFGCARGYTVKAFRQLGYTAFGIDASCWAIENADEEIRDYVKHGYAPRKDYHWIIAKDVLEHIESPLLENTISALLARAKKGLFIIVPLAKESGKPYVVPEYEKDVTHVQRLTGKEWRRLFQCKEFYTRMDYLVPGIKDRYADYAMGNAFITVWRVGA